MKRYLVGGAVRDRLLGRPPRERDWLVTGIDAAGLIARGFRPVGRDFTVFLHPETGEEYALPRVPAGNHDETSRVEQDLRRRDLTINAMALAEDGRLIDPLGGRADLEARRLRHTPAFADDPVRVLRLARLAARYHDLGFRVVQETRSLVRRMAADGRLSGLVPERVWQELERALAGDHPRVFFDTLRAGGALAPLLPELERLFGVPQPRRWHPEIDTGEHSLLSLERACELSPDPAVRFAALLHDLGKGVTPPGLWPHHQGHEGRGAGLVRALCWRLRIPRRFSGLAVAVARYHTDCHRVRELRPATLLHRLQSLDALRRPQRLEPFLLACRADLLGRPGWEGRPYPQADWWRQARDAALAVDAGRIARATADPRRIAEHIRQARVQAIARVRAGWEQLPPLNNSATAPQQ